MAQNVYSVKQVNAYIRNMFAQDYMLRRIYVKGEVSNCKYHSSRHIYFSLKDESGTISCVMFAGKRSGLSFTMKDGQQVVVLGSVEVYAKGGVYQLYADEIRLDGEGILYEKFMQLKRELQEMGMFDPVYKKPIPAYVKRVGVVTAPTGAAVRDIINVSKRRNPYVQLILYPAKVQGEGAAESIVQGIKGLERAKVDVIIVGRGGGSIEDLWAFNEEIVARAIFECEIPIISAVGHATDESISDYVADMHVPTPSAAAEMAVYDYRLIDSALVEYQNKLHTAICQKLRIYRLQMSTLQTKLSHLHPGYKLKEQRRQLMELEEKLELGMTGKLRKYRHRLDVYIERMKGLSPLSKLESGYAYVENTEGKSLRSVKNVKAGEKLKIHAVDGVLLAEVQEILEEKHRIKEEDHD